MSWTLFHERTAFMVDLIERAGHDPETALDFDTAERAEVQRLFGDDDTLVLALRQRWMTNLAAKLDQAAHDDVSSEQARAELAAAQPGLRALLDVAARRSVRLRALDRAEQRIIDYYNGPGPQRQTVA